MNNVELPAGITQEMIEEAKKKYGATGMVKIATLETETTNVELDVLMVRPNRVVIDQMERHVVNDPGTGYSILRNFCLLSHKDEVAKNDELIASADKACIDLLPYSTAIFEDIDMAKLPDGITAEMVEELRSTRNNVKIAKLQQDEDGNRMAVLVCAPARKAITDHEKWDDRNPKKAKQLMIDSIVHSHKELVNANDWLWYCAYNAAIALKPKGAAVIKNC